MSTRAPPSGWRTKENWTPDEEATSCFQCATPFTVLVRRHHCRLCGEIFCKHCVPQNTARNLAGGFVAEAVPACSSCCAKVSGAPLDPTSVQPFYSLEFAPASRAADHDFVHGIVTSDASGTELKFAADALRADRQLVLDAVAHSAAAFRYASTNLREDRQFVVAATTENADVLRYVPERLRADREFILASAQQNGAVLRYATSALQDDEAIVLAAVSHNALAFTFSSTRLQQEKKVALLAVSQDASILALLSPDLRRDREIVLAAAKSMALLGRTPQAQQISSLADAHSLLPPITAEPPEPPRCARPALGELVVLARKKLPRPAGTAAAYSDLLAASKTLEERQEAIRKCDVNATSRAQRRQLLARRDEARHEFIKTATALYETVCSSVAKSRVIAVDNAILDLTSALQQLEAHPRQFKPQHEPEPELEPEPEPEPDLKTVDPLIAADAIIIDIARSTLQDIKLRWEDENSIAVIQDKTDAAIREMLRISKPETTGRLATTPAKGILVPEKCALVVDAIDSERIFRRKTDPATLFPKEKLSAAIRSVIALLEQEVAHTNAMCDAADHHQTLAQLYSQLPASLSPTEELKAAERRVRIARDVASLAQGAVEDADDDTSLERTSTVDRQDAQKHLDRCEAEYTAAMKARSDAVAHLAELLNHCPELQWASPELGKQVELHRAGKLSEGLTPFSRRHALLANTGGKWLAEPEDLGNGVYKYSLSHAGEGVSDSLDAHHFGLAFTQYGALLQGSAQKVTRVEFYENPGLSAKFEATRRKFELAGKDTKPVWVFHGSKKENIPKIMEGGFRVGGKTYNGTIFPVANGTAYGQGVYTATGPKTPMGYSRGDSSIILAKALKGNFKPSKVDGLDSWSNGSAGSDWLIFADDEQVLPVYVVHYQR
eukprot:COSAG02_NODE_5730_length_4084_cov_2.138269_2_plen_898_part_00